jgi:hypothetical protein
MLRNGLACMNGAFSPANVRVTVRAPQRRWTARSAHLLLRTTVMSDHSKRSRHYPLFTLLLLIGVAVTSIPTLARAESLQLKALRVARHNFPGKAGHRRVSVSENPSLITDAGRTIVSFSVSSEGKQVPPNTLVVFESVGSGWVSLGVARESEPRSKGRADHPSSGSGVVTIIVEHPTRRLTCMAPRAKS